MALHLPLSWIVEDDANLSGCAAFDQGYIAEVIQRPIFAEFVKMVAMQVNAMCEAVVIGQIDDRCFTSIE